MNRLLYLRILCGVGLMVLTVPATAQDSDQPVIETPIPCAQTAREMEGESGSSTTVLCPAKCRGPLVWGTDIYANDSSVCVAAQHAGVYDGSQDTSVRVRFLPGKDAYQGSTKNGVTTHHWGAWSRSFSVDSPGASPSKATRTGKSTAGTILTDGGSSASAATSQSVSHATSEPTVSCSTQGDALKGVKGAQHTVTCPSDCKSQPVWGSNPYTDDSSVCAAAIHAGAIDNKAGGRVRLVIQGDIRKAPGSTKNGVKSQAWKYWNRSFQIIRD